MRTKVVALAVAGVAALAWFAVSNRGQSPPGSPDQLPEAGRIGEAVRDGHGALARLFAGTTAGRKEPPEQKKRRMRAVFDQARALDGLIPRDTFDLEAVAKEVGRQPGRLHQWVRRQTTWVPYRGALRGARGALMDRKGNSLDRALLLAGLLASTGVPVRLARAELTDEQAARLMRAPLPAPEKDGKPADVTPGVLSVIEDFARQSGADASVIQQELRRTLEMSRTASEHVRRRADVQSARLLKDLGITAPEVSDNLARTELESRKDHWWVQWQNAAAEWSDLDPDLADAGAAVVPAQGTTDADALPDTLRHVLHVRVIVEKWTGSKLEEQQAVNIDVVPSQVLGGFIRLQHVPLAWPIGLDGPASDLQQRFRSAALSQLEWLPVLTIGDRRITDASILATGDLNRQPGSQPPAAPVGGFMDALSGAEPPPPGELTGEWIEYEIRTPGLAPRIIRREVFDLVGPAARAAGQGPQSLTDAARLSRALSLMTETEILPLACQLSTAFVQHLTTSRILAAESVLMGLIEGRAQPDQLTTIAPFPGLLHDFAVARGEVSQDSGAVYLRSINVLSRHTFPVMAADGTPNVATALDIVANEVASRAAEPAGKFAARLQQGVLDTNLEAVLIGPAARGGTMADLFGLGDSGRGWIALRTVDDLGKAAVRPDIRARIEPDLRAGFTVIAAAAGPTDPAGWWRVDPRTGDTLGLGSRGWGQAMTEYKIVAASAGTFTLCSFGAYLANGQYTARDRVICAIAGLTTMFGGAAISRVPMFGVSVAYTYFQPGIPIITATAALCAALADALGLGW